MKSIIIFLTLTTILSCTTISEPTINRLPDNDPLYSFDEPYDNILLTFEYSYSKTRFIVTDWGSRYSYDYSKILESSMKAEIINEAKNCVIYSEKGSLNKKEIDNLIIENNIDCILKIKPIKSELSYDPDPDTRTYLEKINGRSGSLYTESASFNISVLNASDKKLLWFDQLTLFRPGLFNEGIREEDIEYLSDQIVEILKAEGIL